MNSTFLADNLYVIDDDDIYRLTFTRLLASTGYDKKVYYFEDGEYAIDFLQRNIHLVEELPDLILLDLNMPIMDGWDFIDAFRILNLHSIKDITIYIVSSSVSEEDISKAQLISEVSGYIVKPITKNQLENILLRGFI
ncbi:MAG: response regulator [Microscillaceae bacterium]